MRKKMFLGVLSCIFVFTVSLYAIKDTSATTCTDDCVGSSHTYTVPLGQGIYQSDTLPSTWGNVNALAEHVSDLVGYPINTCSENNCMNPYEECLIEHIYSSDHSKLKIIRYFNQDTNEVTYFVNAKTSTPTVTINVKCHCKNPLDYMDPVIL